MLVNLSNGKTIEMSVEQYLNMSDEEFQYLVATGAGEDIIDPFHQSYIKSNKKDRYDEDEEEEESDVSEDIDYEDEENSL